MQDDARETIQPGVFRHERHGPVWIISSNEEEGVQVLLPLTQVTMVMQRAGEHRRAHGQVDIVVEPLRTLERMTPREAFQTKKD